MVVCQDLGSRSHRLLVLAWREHCVEYPSDDLIRASAGVVPNLRSGEAVDREPGRLKLTVARAISYRLFFCMLMEFMAVSFDNEAFVASALAITDANKKIDSRSFNRYLAFDERRGAR